MPRQSSEPSGHPTGHYQPLEIADRRAKAGGGEQLGKLRVTDRPRLDQARRHAILNRLSRQAGQFLQRLPCRQQGGGVTIIVKI